MILSLSNNAVWFQCLKYIEISIKQCKSGGIDCRVHGLAVMGKIVDDFGDPASSVSFLASDNEDVEVNVCSSLLHQLISHIPIVLFHDIVVLTTTCKTAAIHLGNILELDKCSYMLLL